MKIYTKGNVIVNEIKVGDIHYEYEYGIGIELEVVEAPTRDDKGVWTWVSKRKNGELINYLVTEGLTHYGPNLYDYKAYTVNVYI